MGAFCGMPVLTFYLPFPFILIALLSKIIPYLIAFKLITVLGIFLLPLSAYIYGKLFRFRSPFPQLAAVLATVFLFMKSYSIYGANIMSTLAGEFGYSISFALVFIFLGTLYRGMERGKFDWLFILNCLLLMALVMSHLITTICLLLMIPGILIVRRDGRAILYAITVLAVGLGLTAFWSLPFVDKLPWTTNWGWVKLLTFNALFPSEIRIPMVIAVVGMIYSFRKRDFVALPLFWATFVLVVLYFSPTGGHIWNARILPFIYFLIYLWAAYGLLLFHNVVVYMFKVLFAIPTNVSRRFFTALIAVIVGISVIIYSPTAASWAKWNYSGYESKPDWQQYRQILDFLDELPPGRVINEHDNERISKFGTPRAFELIPYWTNKPTIVNTVPVASFTTVYAFINLAELSPKTYSGITWVDFPSVNVAQGITHLQLMNIRYLIESTPEVVDQVAADSRASILTKIGDFSIFEISGNNRYVEVLKNRPVRIITDNWQESTVPWYLNEADLQVPIIWDRGEEVLKEFKIIDASDVTAPPVDPANSTGDVISEKIENEKITFETTAIGYPHIIKVSYFPNWRVQGADGPFVISPSFMMVIPRQQKVTLTYVPTVSNIAGDIITGIGWLVILALLILNIYKSITGRKVKYIVK